MCLGMLGYVRVYLGVLGYVRVCLGVLRCVLKELARLNNGKLISVEPELREDNGPFRWAHKHDFTFKCVRAHPYSFSQSFLSSLPPKHTHSLLPSFIPSLIHSSFSPFQTHTHTHTHPPPLTFNPPPHHLTRLFSTAVCKPIVA